MTFKIGIIGSGNIGRGLAKHLSKTDHRVLITNSRGAESLKDLVSSIGGSLKAAEFEETIQNADVIFLAVPWKHLKDVANDINAYSGKIIVDATNNIVSVSPFRLADIGGKTTGEFVSQLFSRQRVVKAFNTLRAATLADPTTNVIGETVIFISGEDREAKENVAIIAESMGFAPIDVGTFNEGGKLQDIGGPFSGVELIKVKKHNVIR